MDRVKPILNKTKGDPVYNMSLLLGVLSMGKIVPEANKYYTFVYTAKTPRIQYDQHPFILCGDVFSWGFTGFNQHWEESRRYTWTECQTNLFEIKEDEVESMKNYPTVYIRSN